MKKIKIDFEQLKTRANITSRGGGYEINLDKYHKGARMAVYQNYLGGGLLGRVCVNENRDRSLLSSQVNKQLNQIGEQLKEYYFNLTNSEDSSMTYLLNQSLPISGY